MIEQNKKKAYNKDEILDIFTDNIFEKVTKQQKSLAGSSTSILSVNNEPP